jgi:hypothetical protein
LEMDVGKICASPIEKRSRNWHWAAEFNSIGEGQGWDIRAIATGRTAARVFAVVRSYLRKPPVWTVLQPSRWSSESIVTPSLTRGR